jgi:ribose transport system permease protein
MVLLVLNTQHGFNPYLAAILAILVAAVVGLVNGVLVTWLQIDALVITLGSGSVVAGVTAWVSNQQTLIGLPAGFEKIVISSTILGVAPSFYYSLLLVLVIAYLAHLTPLGRRMLVVGQAREVATLSGIRVNRVRIGCLVGCSALAGLAGVIYAGTSGSASPSGGAELLLPAYAAAFLGATTVTPGRFNAVGALIAVCFLATGVNGLQLLGAPNFVQQLFYGASLIVAAAVSIIAKRHRIASQEIS